MLCWHPKEVVSNLFLGRRALQSSLFAAILHLKVFLTLFQVITGFGHRGLRYVVRDVITSVIEKHPTLVRRFKTQQSHPTPKPDVLEWNLSQHFINCVYIPSQHLLRPNGYRITTQENQTMKNKVQTRQDLLYLLAEASELEHSLACQYLYAAFSLKLPGEEGVTTEQANAIAKWRQIMLSIAVQEMLHLGLASNLLTSIGGAPYFRRANFPQQKTYTTLKLDFRLAGVSEATVRRFCCFELPPRIEPDSKFADWKRICAKERREVAARAVEPLLPRPFNYRSIGALYGLIENGFKELYPDDASRLFIGPSSAQTDGMWASMMAVTNREMAVEAIDRILRQGEGAYGNDEEIEQAHFGKFVSIHDQIQNNIGGSKPAWPVVQNPVLMLHNDIEFEIEGEKLRPTVLTSKVAREANEIFVSLYELALQVLMRYFGNTDETPEQRYILLQVFLSIMRYCLSPLGIAIARLPAFEHHLKGPRAGASFEFYSDTLLLPHKASAWRFFEERLTQISAASEELSSSPNTSCYQLLRIALAGGSSPDKEPGVASVCTKYALAISSGLTPPGTWTWENGVRSFFSPLDVQQMQPFFDLNDEESVRKNSEDISNRIDVASKVRMPPQYLLEDERPEAGGYRNPEGPWTDERISIFRGWADIRPGPPFICPENPVWESDVKHWFNDNDITHMKPLGIDLSSYEDVKDNIGRISSAIETKFMPPGGWPDAKISCFEKWVAAGLPKGKPPLELTWSPTTAPRAQRYDDVFFIDRKSGWAVNSNAHVLYTTDAGGTWELLHVVKDVNDKPIYLRCIQFANANRGFLGTVSSEMRLYTTSDGGRTWEPENNLPAEAPLKICGLTMVDENVVYATGTNEPSDFAAIMKTTDSGQSWTAKSLEEHASILIDNYFFDDKKGLVVGGYTSVPRDKRTRDDVKPVILLTEDGGETWVNLLKDFTSQYPKGEWGWKIDVVSPEVIFVSLENFHRGAVAKTVDGGKTWIRLPINDAQGNANLEGVGFINDDVGWVGGWGDASFEGGFTSATKDGGENWRDANEVGRFINRFRFFGSPVDLGYASGDTIYKYSDEPAPTPEAMAALVEAAPPPLLRGAEKPVRVGRPFPVRFKVPPGARRLRVHIWNQFANFLCTLVTEANPAAGERRVLWDGNDENGETVPPGVCIYRLQIDDKVESHVIYLDK